MAREQRVSLPKAMVTPTIEAKQAPYVNSMTISQPQVIVCERAEMWAAAIKRHLPPTARLRQTRSLGECESLLQSKPASLVVVELASAKRAAVVKWLGQLQRQFPLARAIVVADRGAESSEWLVREAGAIHFTTSPRELIRWNVIVRNQATRDAPSKADFVEQLWDMLPWSETATVG